MPRSRRYAFLRFQPDVNWRDVDETLLARLNNLGAAIGKIITITSGYRTRVEQAGLYERYKRSGFDRKYIAAPPGASNHEHGGAVDAVIEGKALASAVSAKTLKKYGLKAPVGGDPVHIELSGKVTAKKAAASKVRTSSFAEAPGAGNESDMGAAAVPLDVPQAMPAGAPPPPEATLVPLAPPGTGANTAYRRRDLWQLVASMPDADPETLTWATRSEMLED